MRVKLDIYGYILDTKTFDEDGNEVPPEKKLSVALDGDNSMIMNIQSYLNEKFIVK